MTTSNNENRHDCTESLDNVYSTAVDNNEVATLLNEMRDQQQMQVNGQIAAGQGNIANPNAVQQNDMTEMQNRLNDIKGL